jgi:succinyl-diaminopimelate desuccinylase
MMSNSPGKFAEKYLLARETALTTNVKGGTAGFELEWNMYDTHFKPVHTIGSGPDQESFVDYLRAHAIPAWLSDRNQLEVFHWMIEWATRPYYSTPGAVYEGRLLEAFLYNALARAGREFGERLYAFPGILLYPARVGHDSIPGGWNLAKRRYLERCVDIYGPALATAGIHANLSLPEPLLSWDFIHLSLSERGDAHAHLDDYKNRVYVEGTRLMRAFAALFIATSAATPMRAELRDGQPLVILTELDSNRNFTFPNPETLDVPGLYRSHADYLQASYDLVTRGIRFGNNNWTPVRARSFAEPVERLISTTSDQLHAIYHRGLYAADEPITMEEMARQIERENLLARINIPMARVEVRTDEGGHALDLDVANLTIKELLLILFYADPTFARAFRYDHEDLARARRNETAAAERGLRAEIENPFTGKPVGVRDFLGWTLEQLRGLAEALGWWPDLAPLVEMASGAPNTAERMREQIRRALDGRADAAVDELEVPTDLLKQLAVDREKQVARDVEHIATAAGGLGAEAPKLRELLQRARDDVRHDPAAPIRFRPERTTLIAQAYPDKTSEILDLARQLIRIPSVTNCADERLDEVHRAGTLAFDYLRDSGLEARYYDQTKYPAVLAGFPGQLTAAVMLSGHFDVVQPEPDDSQFEPRLEGDYLWGRGAADMKTVVATYLTWMKDAVKTGPPYPAVNLCLVGNEENGEGEPTGTPHVLADLAANNGGYGPRLFIAGERTGEKGDERMGEVCVENRGVMRFEVVARGTRAHSALAGASADLGERLLQARLALADLFQSALTLKAAGGWQSQYRFPFITVGLPGVYNITADHGVLGVEVRSIPQDDLQALAARVRAYCAGAGLELKVTVQESGIICDANNPYLLKLLDAVCEVGGQPAVVGRKLPGTSARFAPGGQGVVWGQSGIGPHARDERHYVPSIDGHYRALAAFGRRLTGP